MPVMTVSEAAAGDSERIARQFDEHGYVIVRRVLDPTRDLQPVLDEYAAVLDRLAHAWHAAGEISSTFAKLPFEGRLIAIMGEAGERLYDHFRIFFNPPSATTADSPIHCGPAIFGLITHPKLLDVIAALIGQEITLTPVNILRLKVPEHRLPANRTFHIGMTSTFWHQDQGTFAQDISEIDVLTCWLPLTDITQEMGCLQVVPGSHRGPLAVHCAHHDPARMGIPETLIGEGRHCIEMAAGDVHFHHRRLQHGSLRNVSERVRFSFDLRYQPTTQPTGYCGAVPEDFRVPGVILRSPSAPAEEIHDWRVWRDYHEAMRAAFMGIDWKTNRPRSQFTADHPYCV